jgi:hypothetical protein
MSLDRTTIIDDVLLAQTQFQQNVCSGKLLVIVVLGNDENSQKAAECADHRAGTVVSGIGRSVVWIKDRTLLIKEINNLHPGVFDVSLKGTVSSVK